MNSHLIIGHHAHEARHLRKKIKKWVKRGWAEPPWHTPDGMVYKMNLPYYITEDNKLKVDYDKLFRIKAILGERNPRHTVEGE